MIFLASIQFQGTHYFYSWKCVCIHQRITLSLFAFCMIARQVLVFCMHALSHFLIFFPWKFGSFVAHIVRAYALPILREHAPPIVIKTTYICY